MDKCLGRILLLAIPLLLTGCTWWFSSSDSTKQLHNLSNYPGIEYNVELKVKGEESLKSYIESSSKLFVLKAKPPISSNALRYRVVQDIKNIKRALKHKGYFDVKVKARILIRPKPKEVIVEISTGPQYKIGGIGLEIMDHSSDLKLTPSKLGRVVRINIDDQVDQDKIFEANLYLEKYFKNHGYPFVKVEIPDGKLNKDTKHLSVLFKVRLNHKSHYGSTTIKGLKAVSSSFVRNRIIWREGELYDDRQVEKTKRKLIESELFSSVSITPVDQPHDKTPLELELVEAPARTIGAGVEYTTSKGPGARALWTHRNLKGAGETFRIEGKGNQKEAIALMSYEIPDVFFPDLHFHTWVSARYDNTRAYRGSLYDLYTGLKWYGESLTASGGMEYERSKLTRTYTQKTNYFSLPLAVDWDKRNDILNPYKGWRLLTQVTPYMGNMGQSSKMLKLSINGNYYLRIIKKDAFVIGFWGRLGEISHIRDQDIPLDKRFYSGGLNSVRGYGYQKIGPIDQHANPTGGKFLSEFGIEPRFKITDTIGAVCFVEAGSVGNARTAAYKKEPYYIGYGIGARYYTPIGPIRVDLAFPTRKRRFKGEKYDAPFQLYISIGQAF